MGAEGAIYTTEAWTEGVYMAATIGLTLGWAAFGALAEPAPDGVRYTKYVLFTALVPVGFGGSSIVLALNGYGSLDTVVAYAAGLTAWNVVQYYLFPAALLALIEALPRFLDGIAFVVRGIRSLSG